MPLIVKINVALRKHFCQKIGSERVKEPFVFNMHAIIFSLSASLRAMAQHHNGVLRNESLLRPGPHTLGLFDVRSTFGIRNTYCPSISSEIMRC